MPRLVITETDDSVEEWWKTDGYSIRIFYSLIGDDETIIDHGSYKVIAKFAHCKRTAFTPLAPDHQNEWNTNLTYSMLQQLEMNWNRSGQIALNGQEFFYRPVDIEDCPDTWAKGVLDLVEKNRA